MQFRPSGNNVLLNADVLHPYKKTPKTHNLATEPK